MRLVTYDDGSRGPRSGVVVDRPDGPAVLDLADVSGGRLPSDLLALLERGDDALAAARSVVAGDGPARPLTDVTLCAPLRRPPKFLATAGNYQAHIVEGGLPPVDKTRIVPKLFLKPSTTIIGPDAPVVLPRISDTVDWELELGVVIGRAGRDIALERAMDHVLGYTIINDVSARSMAWGLADRESTNWDGFFDWLNGKWPDGFAPVGPWIVTADEIVDPHDLSIELRVNDTVRQSGSTAEMLFRTDEIIAFASRFMTLEPGDIIATGTPAGVGDTTKTYLRSGDVMTGTIAGLGTLRTPVAG